MVTFTQDQKNLTVPSALGNFASNGSGGSGVTPAEVQEMINNALSGYDETVQGYISDVDVDVEQNKEDIQDLSGTTSALTEGLNSLSGTVSSLEEGVATISGQTAQITAITGQIEAISGATEQNAQDIAALSATTSGISSDVDSLGTKVESLSGITSGISNDLSSLGTDVESLSGATSGIATDLQALSGATEGLAQTLGDKANTSDLEALSAATSGVAVNLETLSAYTETLSGAASNVVLEYANNTSSEINKLGAAVETAYNNGKNIFLKGKNAENDGYVVLPFYKYILYADNPRYYFRGVYSTSDNNSAVTYNVYIQKNIATGNWAIGGVSGSHFSAATTISNYSLPTASSNTLGGVKVGSGLTIDGNGVLSVSGGTGGGIEKVDVLPLTAEEGDIVWLNGETKTGYTILCAETDEGWPWELDRYYLNVNGDDKLLRIGDYGPVGKWIENESFNNLLFRIRITSDIYPLLDVIDMGNNTIDKGSDAVSITSNVEFPMKGCLYVYKNNMWVAKPEFFWKYNSTEVQSVATRMFQGIEEFDIENFFIQYNCFIDGKTKLLNFKAYTGAFYGNDFKSLDNNSNNSWENVKVMCYRLTPAGAFSDLVGSKSMSVDDVIYDQIPYKIADSFKAVKVNSGGTIIDNTWDNLGILGNMYKKSAMVEFEYEENNYFSASTIKYWYRQFEQVGGEDKLFYYCCAEIPINGTVYKGIWKWEEYNYPQPFTPLSWTQVQ